MGGCLGGVLGVLLAPFILISMVLLMIVMIVAGSFGEVANGGNANYSEFAYGNFKTGEVFVDNVVLDEPYIYSITNEPMNKTIAPTKFETLVCNV